MKKYLNKIFTKFKLPQTGQLENQEAELSTPKWYFRFSLEEQISFAKRLSILLRAGIPTLQALIMLQAQTTKPASLAVVGDLVEGVRQGQFLHVRMEKFRKYFGDFAINIVRVGEVSGSLNDNLGYLVHELKKKRDLKRKLIGALIYPVIIMFATFGITILLVVYVFPKILPILQGFKGTLPFSTRVLIFISHLLATRGWLIFLGAVALVTTFTLMVRKSFGTRYWLHARLIQLPVLGSLFKSYYMSNLCRTFGILLKSEVPIVETTKIASLTATNLVYKNSLIRLAEQLTSGGTVSSFFTNEKNIYPAMVAQMTHVGETTGSLSDTLLYVADVYEQEVEDITKNLSTSIEPILMVFMGVLVGFIAMSIITPIYSLTQSLSR